MALFRVSVSAFVAASVVAAVADEAPVCSSNIHCERGRDEESALQSVSLLQKDTVIVKGMQSGSTRVMAELTPSGEAVSLPAEDQTFSEDETVSFAPAHGSQHYVAAEQHRLHASVERAAAAAAAAERVKPIDFADADPAAENARVRKIPMADMVDRHLTSRRKTRRILPGVSLLGRMSATVARHGIHAAHKAGVVSQAPHPHEEDAETLLVAVGLFLLGIFSMGCLVLEHRSKEQAEARAMKLLASTLNVTPVYGAGEACADAKQPAQDVQQHEVPAAVGAPIAAGPVRVA